MAKIKVNLSRSHFGIAEEERDDAVDRIEE
jgi:hypothetical protein